MIPLYKLFMVSARMFAKPVVSLIKRRHKASKELAPGFVERFFIYIGNREYRMDQWMNRKLINDQLVERVAVKPLNDDLALEKGIEFFYEFLVYFIIISVTVMELNKAANQSKAGTLKRQAEVDALESKIRELEMNSAIQIEALTKMGRQLDSMNKLLLSSIKEPIIEGHKSLE